MSRIYTEAMQAVIGPISGSVSDLLANVDKKYFASAGTTAAGKQIMESCKTLADTGLVMVQGREKELSTEMSGAAAQLALSGEQLYAACLALMKDASSSVAKQSLIAGCRGILQSTIAILEMGDEADVQSLIDAAEQSLAGLRTLSCLTNASDIADQATDVGYGLVEVAQKTAKRGKQLPVSQHRDQVIRANQMLRQSAPNLVSAMHVFLANQSDTTALKMKIKSIEAVQLALERIINILRQNLNQPTNAINESERKSKYNFGAISKALALCSSDSADNQKEPMTLPEGLPAYLESATNLANQCSLEELKNALLAAVERTAKLSCDFQSITVTCHADNSESNLIKYHSIASLLLSEADNVNKLVQHVHMARKEEVVARANHSLARLAGTLANKDSAGVKNSAQSFASQSSCLVDVASSIAADIPDISLASSVSQEAANQKLSADILVQASSLAANHSQPESIAHAQRAANQSKADVTSCSEAIDRALGEKIRAIDVNEIALVGSANRLVAVATQPNEELFETASQSLECFGERAVQLTLLEADNCDNQPMKKALETQAESLRSAVIGLVQGANELQRTPSNSQLSSKMDAAHKNLLEKLKARRELLGQSSLSLEKIKEIENAFSLDEQQSNQKQPVDHVSNIEAELSALSLADGTDEDSQEIGSRFVQNSKIGLAARDLYIGASQWSGENKKLSEVAKAMALLFNRMAEISDQPQCRAELIGLAREIASQSRQCTALCRASALDCIDLRIRSQLEGLMARLGTIAAQLQIVAAVKASHYMDEESDSQLTICAQNLLCSVANAVPLCSTAALCSLARRGSARKGLKS